MIWSFNFIKKEDKSKEKKEIEREYILNLIQVILKEIKKYIWLLWQP